MNYLKDLAGTNDWESAQCDMIVDCVEDLIRPLFDMVFLEDKVEKVSF